MSIQMLLLKNFELHLHEVFGLDNETRVAAFHKIPSNRSLHESPSNSSNKPV